MTEHKFFTDPVAYVSTLDYHRDRERAPHLEQDIHRGRLDRAAEFILSVGLDQRLTVSDLGCGDGGLLSLIEPSYVDAGMVGFCWGYDFAPANAVGWADRNITASAMSVFGDDDVINAEAQIGDIVVMTEVLEHLTHPHAVLRELIYYDTRYVVASSPWDEGPGNHDASHAWAWDLEGYREMFERAGWTTLRHEKVDRFQVVLAVRT